MAAADTSRCVPDLDTPAPAVADTGHRVRA